MKLYTNFPSIFAILTATSISLTNAILVQPYNHMLDDSGLDGGANYNEQIDGLDKTDIVGLIGNSLARLHYGRMLNDDQSVSHHHHHHHNGFSQEMAELIQNEQQDAKQDGSQEPSLSSSVANLLMNVAQAAAANSAGVGSNEEASQLEGASGLNKDSGVSMNSRGSIMELDTTSSNSASAPSKADLKSGTSQWFNPKETIPVLKISSMATPSKYKKVYFRSEKKLVDGAFHSPASEQDEKKSLMKPFNSGVQRRSSRGTSSSVAPPNVLQDGVVDFLRKFREVYIQTRPVNSAASSSLALSASSPLASVLSPSGSRPSNLLMSALNGASLLAMAAPPKATSSSSSSSSTGTKPSASAASPVASAAASAVVAAASSAAANQASSSPSRQPFSAQSYVSFWSETFPKYVRRILKQMRRRSLYNSSRRQKQHQQQHSAIGQAAQAAASVASVVDQATGGSSSQPSKHSM